MLTCVKFSGRFMRLLSSKKQKRTRVVPEALTKRSRKFSFSLSFRESASVGKRNKKVRFFLNELMKVELQRNVETSEAVL